LVVRRTGAASKQTSNSWDAGRRLTQKEMGRD
jgi:hypothetical protein